MLTFACRQIKAEDALHIRLSSCFLSRAIDASIGHCTVTLTWTEDDPLPPGPLPVIVNVKLSEPVYPGCDWYMTTSPPLVEAAPLAAGALMTTDVMMFVPPVPVSIRQTSPLLTDIEVLVFDPRYGMDHGMTPHSAYAGTHQPRNIRANTMFRLIDYFLLANEEIALLALRHGPASETSRGCAGHKQRGQDRYQTIERCGCRTKAPTFIASSGNRKLPFRANQRDCSLSFAGKPIAEGGAGLPWSPLLTKFPWRCPGNPAEGASKVGGVRIATRECNVDNLGVCIAQAFSGSLKSDHIDQSRV